MSSVFASKGREETKYEVSEKNISKTLDLDSSYRDRKTWPYQCDFVVPFTTSGRRGALRDSTDPVSLAVPFEFGTTQGLGTDLSVVVLNTGTSSTLDNFYVNNVLQLTIGGLNEYRTILSYSGSIHTAVVNAPYSANTSALSYAVRHARPIYEGVLQAGTTSSILRLEPAAPTYSFVGQFVRITSGVSTGISKPIVSYSGTSISVLNDFSPAPVAGDRYEIDPFSFDNPVPLIYSGTSIFSQAVCYRIRLLTLTIPFVILKSYYGGAIDSYPYLYVRLYSENAKSSEQSLYSNNPASKMALFKVPIDVSLYSPDSSFVTLYCDQNEVVKFKPNDSLHFTVTHSNGEIVKFAEDDYASPLEPNPLLQVDATFELYRMS